MKKIMFNDRYGLTQAVLEGRKTMTRRRVCKPDHDEVFDNSVDRFNKGWSDHVELIGSKRAYAYKPRYKVGEIVAVAQKYSSFIKSSDWDATDKLAHTKGWNNKMFVAADLMPHQIRITAVRAERLQDISDEDCMKEGIQVLDGRYYYRDNGGRIVDDFGNPREAFASLIDKVSGKGTWNRNPWVWVYEFELVK